LNDIEQPRNASAQGDMAGDAPRPWIAPLRKWAFLAVPAVGILELALHLWQTNAGIPASDWRAARDLVKTLARPDDLVLVAPRWADPVGREYLGSDVLTVEREARADETGFARAIQVSVGHQRAPELAHWKRTAEQSIGGLTVSTLENPSSVPILDKLLAHGNPGQMRVFQEDRGREIECPFAHGAAQAGSLGFGPAVPADKFSCPGGGFVGVSIIATLDYTPRRCFYAPVMSGTTSIRIRFQDVAIGRTLHGHHGLYVEAERFKTGSPINIAFSFDQGPLATFTHHDGEGWASFDVSTAAFAGQKKELIADITGSDGNRRMYCFEADTR
jgi:hypothetical protein